MQRVAILVDVIALYSGDWDYAEAVRRARALGLRVEVYAIRASHHLSTALERSANSTHDLEAQAHCIQVQTRRTTCAQAIRPRRKETSITFCLQRA